MKSKNKNNTKNMTEVEYKKHMIKNMCIFQFVSWLTSLENLTYLTTLYLLKLSPFHSQELVRSYLLVLLILSLVYLWNIHVFFLYQDNFLYKHGFKYYWYPNNSRQLYYLCNCTIESCQSFSSGPESLQVM